MNLVALTFSFLASTTSIGRVPPSRYFVIDVIHELLISIGFSSFPLWLGEFWTSIRWLVASSKDANFAKASASMFCSQGIWTMITLLKLVMMLLTRSRYFLILSSFASYSPLTYPTTNCESLCTFSVVTPNTLAMRRPISRASYIASLLVVRYWSRTTCFKSLPLGVLKTIPTPPAPLTDDPSMLTSHFSCGSPSSCGGSSLAAVNSTMKSTRAWALITCLGRYSILNSLNSVAH